MSGIIHNHGGMENLHLMSTMDPRLIMNNLTSIKYELHSVLYHLFAFI